MNEMDAFEFKGVKLDLMCGHLWSFIKAGSEIDSNFEYKDIVNIDNYHKGVDIKIIITGNYQLFKKT